MKKLALVAFGMVAFASGYTVQAHAGEAKAEDTKVEKSAEEAGKEKPFKMVTAEELKDLIKENENLIIVDSRGGKYFDGKVITGAVNLPADKTTPEALAEIAADKSTPIAFYCTNVGCHASELSAYKAAEAGYTNIYKYPGGIEEWVSKGFEVAQLDADAAKAEPAAGKAEKEEKAAN